MVVVVVIVGRVLEVHVEVAIVVAASEAGTVQANF